jgi:hypothetical protein
MRSITPAPRGMALIMAMIVVVLITMLVAGAISFTGTEVAASQVQSQEAAMSACIQAARNLFISRLQLKPDLVPCNTPLGGGGAPVPPPPPPPPGGEEQCLFVDFDDTFLSAEHPGQGHRLTTGHLGTLHRLSGKLSGTLNDRSREQGEDSQQTGDQSSGPKFFIVTAVCSDNTVAGAPEREIEFMVRTDL